MNENKAWNIGGAIAGIVLGLLSVLGIVASQTSAAQDQPFTSVIAYDEAS